MIRLQGPMMTLALGLGAESPYLVAASAELRAAADPVPLLPTVLQVGRLRPRAEEDWPAFKDRVAEHLGEVMDRLHSNVGVAEVQPSFAGNSLATALTAEQLEIIAQDPGFDIDFLELDPLLPVVAMDTVMSDIGVPAFSAAYGGLTGSGVRVAVLDSGIDAVHPALNVQGQVETCGESVHIPGSHGTHCAGILASNDPKVRGVAPGVELFDVKVFRANGFGRFSSVTAGIDRALDLRVDVLSMSLAFNHLSTRITGGHGWTCPDGNCPLCLAVDNAVGQGAVVVVAAGNDHDRCQRARTTGAGLLYDTELGCPGHARGAITVGSVEKHTHWPAANSSSGPTADGRGKPDLSAPGVDVLSTVPLPRDEHGVADLNAPRSLQFAIKSGTSMAAPMVAGACALLIESAIRLGTARDPASIRAALMARCVEPVGGPGNVLGAGRLRLA